ncbi:MAG: 23S rRNA (pseudouridine(1915)-N(3))-methyltransferase RlmH [Acidiferrobacteraceae bacterium]|nr:23S rRNA (pseudouridine(1915)-N(3))-methyltransferase RlmH [Acidiferrobacteraceae bacterium]|tara:strand:+ start:1929 stop:2405 length:477 start_codon:yes stop_codon:yes gene_type:complete
MRLLIIAIGDRTPDWISEGFAEYSRRFQRPWELTLKEISANKRKRHANITRIVDAEGERLLAAIPRGWFTVALDQKGIQFDTEALTKQLKHHSELGNNIAFLIGGPDGLSANALNRVDAIWSLSTLTLAHAVVRLVAAEQLYRVFSIIKGLPYHRGAR